MTDTEGNELDCYEAVEAVDHHPTEVIHLGMDVQEIEGGQTYWNVYVPTKWDHGQRLLLLSQEEFRAVGNVLLLEALAMPDYSVLSPPETILVNNLVAPMGKFHLDVTMRQCPAEHSTVLDRLGDNYSCSECKAIYDDDGELVDTFGVWEQIDPNTQEFDDTLGIVRNEAMEITHDPTGLFAELYYCNDDGHLLTPTGSDGNYHCPDCGRTFFISDEDLALGRFQDAADGPFSDEEEARQAYEDYGGPNHSNHDDFQK